MTPKFSVIIPTRERADTLEKSLATVVAQDYDDVEILVSDNCSTDSTREVVAAANDSRVRYINTGARLSMSANWEFALAHATGEWITILGDDDGLIPGALRSIDDLARKTGANAIRTLAAWFEWPSVTGGPSGRLHLPITTGWERRDSAVWRQRVLAGRAHYYDLPMLYTGGFVKATVVDSARAVGGRFYRSSIPDVYSAMLLSRLLPDFVFSHEPVAIFGTSRHSIGASMLGQAAGRGDAQPAELFRQEGNIAFHPAVPTDGKGAYPKTIQALVYESYLQVAEILPESPRESATRQLTVILATAGAQQGAVSDWGHRFAAMHGIDFDKASADARRYARRLAAVRFPAQAARALRTCTAGTVSAPLVDVLAASLIARAVKAAPPNRLRLAAEAISRRVSHAAG